ncbi:hypothetical protein LOTGIDRAFT_223980 [Lottia gigantea]|uniref:Cytochrome P450 n=1 Tax=Lottia gigantea TaxID=225164 RepID=V4BEL0_LOTGI|nr:hypothetical protein LOTGIDRAFT_223980 [Lottia gigantea]ESP04227.1 hypothetical protein LOTGIDRAFT_223980 [Lottia gigantea]
MRRCKMNVYGFISSIPSWVLVLTLAVFLLYMYVVQKYRFFKELGVDGPTPGLLLGNVAQLKQHGGLVHAIRRWKEQYGSVFGIFICRQPRLVISNLDILKDIFIKEFNHFSDREEMLVFNIISKGVFFQRGNNWKRIRSIITPTFSSGKLKLMFPSILDCGHILSRNMVANSIEGTPIDVKNCFGAYTMDVIARTAFGIDVDSQTNPDEPFVHMARKLFTPRKWFGIVYLIISSIPLTIPLFRYLDIGFFPSEPTKFFVRSIQEMIRQRKDNSDSFSKGRADFLQLLIRAEGDESNGDSMKSTDRKTVKKLSSEEIIGQAFLFFIAGYETTGTTLQYVAYILATHPDVQDRVIEEIEHIIGDRDPTYEDINKLSYMELMIQETLRMYPPVVSIGRKASDDVTIKGLKIPKDTAVLVPIYSIHHDPEIFENPDEFIPERFENKNVNPIKFLPFGCGPRVCIGLRLAMVEAKVALVTVLQKVKFVRHEQTVNKVEFEDLGLLVPKNKLIVGVELRQKT